MHRHTIAVVVALFVLAADAQAREDVRKSDSSIRIAAGASTGDLDTVNGSIRIGDEAVVGDAQTVNGGIRIGRRARADSASTVNGSIEIGAGSLIAGDVATVNGSIEAAPGVAIVGGVQTVNGAIQLTRTRVEALAQTVAGDLTLTAGTRVGGIRMGKPTGWYWGKPRIPWIVIGPDAVVDGPLDFEREVVLYVHTSARIGPVRGAEVRRYAGAEPPP